MSAVNVQDVQRLHEEATVFIGYQGLYSQVTREGVTYLPFADWPVNIPQFKAGGVDAFFFSFGAEGICVSPPGLLELPSRVSYRLVFKGSDVIKRVLRSMDGVWRAAETASDLFAIALSASDVRRANKHGKIAGIMHLTGGLIDKDLAVLRDYYRLGLRSIHVAMGDCVEWADSSEGVPVCGGLSDFGREVIREMNRLGMVIDLAHASDQTAKDILSISEHPVIVSHSTSRALVPLMRSAPDDQLEALARNGGVVGVMFVPLHLDRAYLDACVARGDYDDYICRVQAVLAERYEDPFELAVALSQPEELEAAREAAGLPPRPPIASGLPFRKDCLLDHIDHIVRVAGVDHVGLGSDAGSIPLHGRLEEFCRLSMLTAALLERGYGEEDVRKILGGNFMRVLKAVTG